MRKQLTLAGLLVVCGAACVHPPPTAKLPKSRASYPRFVAPRAITEANYARERDIYDALPPETPGRVQFRALLLGHLMSKIEKSLARGQEADALESFRSAATLFHPKEVYQGAVRDDRFAALAARLVQRFSPAGNEDNVLLPLCVQMTLSGKEAALRPVQDEIVGWIDETQILLHGRGAGGAHVIRVLERVIRTWPSAALVARLAALYRERRMTVAQALGADLERGPQIDLPTLLQGAYVRTGHQVARMYLLVDRPYDALTWIRRMGDDSPAESELRQLLEQAVSPSASASDQVRLAEHFEERDRDVALRVCEGAVERYPDQAAGYECLGRVAAATDHFWYAVTSLERAVQLAPDQLSYAEALDKAYQRRLFEMIGEEQLEEAQRQLLVIERFQQQIEKRFGKKLAPGLSRAYYAMGHGLYNAGQAELAAAALEKSVAAEATPDALLQLATLRLKKEDASGAQAYLARAERCPITSPAERLFWQGRIEGLRGRALELSGRVSDSQGAHRRALDAWREWQGLSLRPEARAEALVYHAQSLYAVGERARAIDALERAIDVQPERKETYADAIAMLITYGHLPEALDALHRALGRTEVSEYLKTYCSLWVIGLARRAGLPPDPLALNHLQSLSGTAWYVRLADLVLGKRTYQELLTQAKTVGNRAELYYYWAEQLLWQGQKEAARTMWRRVIGTDMMAFYEYDMSAFNLRHGAAVVLTRPLDRQPDEATSSKR